jgi:hypothetical protein
MRSSGAPFEERLAAAAEAGAVCVQSGSWSGIRFAYLDTVDLIGTYLEIMDVPQDFHLPAPDEWYPHESESAHRPSRGPAPDATVTT